MLKRAFIIALMGVGMIPLRSGNVDAHLQGYAYTPTLRHVASHDCNFFADKVRNLSGESEFGCTMKVKQAEYICQNPGTKEKIILNDGHPPIVFGASTTLGTDPGLFTGKKKRNKLEASVRLTDDTLLEVGDGLCAEHWRNFTAADVRVIKTEVILEAREWLDGVGLITSPTWCARLVCETTVGADLGFDTEYDFNCDNGNGEQGPVEEYHLDGADCPIF